MRSDFLHRQPPRPDRPMVPSQESWLTHASWFLDHVLLGCLAEHDPENQHHCVSPVPANQVCRSVAMRECRVVFGPPGFGDSPIFVDVAVRPARRCRRFVLEPQQLVPLRLHEPVIGEIVLYPGGFSSDEPVARVFRIDEYNPYSMCDNPNHTVPVPEWPDSSPYRWSEPRYWHIAYPQSLLQPVPVRGAYDVSLLWSWLIEESEKTEIGRGFVPQKEDPASKPG